MTPFWGIRPQEVAPYEKQPPAGNQERRFYRLSRPALVLTPNGYVDAQAGDVLEVRANGLWVLAGEILDAWGVVIKEMKDAI